jgi:hypothetical protein
VDAVVEVVLPPVPVPPVPGADVLRVLLVTAEEPAAPAPPEVADEELLLDWDELPPADEEPELPAWPLDELDTEDELTDPPEEPEEPPALPVPLSALSQAPMARAPAANIIMETWSGLMGGLLCGGRWSLLVEQPQADHELVQENDFAMHQNAYP